MLCETVELSIVVPYLVCAAIPPPSRELVLPETVDPVTEREPPSAAIPPPLGLLASLPSIWLPVIETLSKEVLIPPPICALLPLTVLSLIVRSPYLGTMASTPPPPPLAVLPLIVEPEMVSVLVL